MKVSAADSGGGHTLMEDSLQAGFGPGLHMHRSRAETFHVPDGPADFFVGGDWMTAVPGACLHVPPGVPHACVMSEGCSAARMLMIFQPAGFDLFLAEPARMNEADFRDRARMTSLEDRYDIVRIGPVPDRPQPEG